MGIWAAWRKFRGQTRPPWKNFLLEKFPRGPSPDKPLAETDDELALIWPEIIASLYKHFFYKHLGTHYGLIERLI